MARLCCCPKLNFVQLCRCLQCLLCLNLRTIQNERLLSAHKRWDSTSTLNPKPAAQFPPIFAIKFPSISSERDADQAVERHARDLPLKRGCKEYLPSCGKLDDAANFDIEQPMQGVITGINSTNERACLHARDFIIDASLKQQAHNGLEASVCSVAQRARAVAAEGMR